MNSQLPPPSIRHQLCGEAMCGEPTLRRYLTGLPVKPSTALRIEKAAKALGLEHLLPQAGGQP